MSEQKYPALNSMDAIKAAESEYSGGMWFSKETMRWWKTRLSHKVYPMGDLGTLFVTSDRGPDGRVYSVRRAYFDSPSGYTPPLLFILTLATFGAYGSLRRAHSAARRLAKELTLRDAENGTWA